MLKYDKKYLISDFYCNKNLICILTLNEDKMNSQIIEVKIGPRRILKLEYVDISSINLTIWYKDSLQKIFYKTIKVIPEKKDTKLLINVKKILESIVKESLEINNRTISTYLKYPPRYTLDICKKGLILKRHFWLDCDYYSTDFYFSNDVIKIKNQEINTVGYKSVFGDMTEFYNILKSILNKKYDGEFLDIFDFIGSITEYIKIQDTSFNFEEYLNGIIKIKRFDEEFKILNNANLKTIIIMVLSAKDELYLKNKISEMKLLGII